MSKINKNQLDSLFDLIDKIGWVAAYNSANDNIEGLVIGTEDFVNELINGPEYIESGIPEEALTEFAESLEKSISTPMHVSVVLKSEDYAKVLNLLKDNSIDCIVVPSVTDNDEPKWEGPIQ